MPAPGTCPCCGQGVEPGRLLVDLNSNRATRGDVTVYLTNRQAEILTILAAAAPAIVQTDRLLLKMYGADGGPDEIATLKAHICYLRRRIGALGVAIETKWGEGYRLVFDQAGGGLVRGHGSNRPWSEAELEQLGVLIFTDRLSIAAAAARLDRPVSGTARKATHLAYQRKRSEPLAGAA